MGELRFDGRVAVVTGGGRGLGRSYALLLGARGAKVVVNDNGGNVHNEGFDAGPAEQVAREIREAGGEAVACVESVATPEGGQAIVDAAVSAFGGLDILVHNAGNVRKTPLREMTSPQFDEVLDVHLRGAFHVTRPAFALMCDAGYGRIVLTSSICGVYGCPGEANYGTGKTGVIGLSNIAALEGAEHGVQSNVILPAAVTRMAASGWDMTGYPPMTEELVAPTVAWLAHESCPVSGEMYTAIAGRVAKVCFAESPGVFQPGWTIEDVAARSGEIRDMSRPKLFPTLPAGHDEHIQFSFELAQQ